MSTVARPDLLWRDLKPKRDVVRRRLSSVRTSIRGFLALIGATATLLGMLVFFLVSLTADYFARFGIAMRVSLLVLGVAGIGYLAWRFLFKPLSVKLDDLDLATILDKRQPGVGLHVANILQLPDLIEHRPQASPALVHAAVTQHSQELERTDLLAVVHSGRRSAVLTVIAMIAVFLILFPLVAPATAGLWARRWLLASSERWPQGTYMSVIGLGDESSLLVPRGESFLLEVSLRAEYEATDHGSWRLLDRGSEIVELSGSKPPKRFAAPESVSIRFRRPDGEMQYETRIVQEEEDDVQFELPPFAGDAELLIRGGDDWIGPITITPVDRPAVDRHELWYRGPQGGDWQPGSDDDPRFLRDSDIRLKVFTSVPVDVASLAAKKGESPALVRDASDGGAWVAEWKLVESQTFEVSLTGGVGELESKPHLVNVGIRDDAKPKTTIRYSGVGKKVTPQATIPLNIRAVDDYGLASLTESIDRVIKTGDAADVKTTSRPIALPESSTPVLDYESSQRLSLKELEVVPGVQLKIKATSIDNCARGQQTGESRVLTFSVVTPEELFYEILGRQRVERAKFVAAIASAKTQVSDLAVLVNAEQGQLIDRKHQVIARQVWQVANRLDAILQELTLNELGSPKDRDIQEKIIEALRRLYEERLADLGTKLRDVTSDPENAGEKLAEVRTLQQEAVTEMEKILAQMQFWESFVDVVNQVNQVIKLQSGVQEATEKESKTRTDTIFDEDEEGTKKPPE